MFMRSFNVFFLNVFYDCHSYIGAADNTSMFPAQVNVGGLS